MANKKKTCPVCMTKMLPRGEDMVCPECGYKYCANRKPYVYDEHNHAQYQTYARQVSYTGNNTPRQTPVSTQGAQPQPRANSPQQSYAQPRPNSPQGTSGQTQQNRNISRGTAAQPGQSTPQGTYLRTQPVSTQPRQGKSTAREPKSPLRIVGTVFAVIFILNVLFSILFEIIALMLRF